MSDFYLKFNDLQGYATNRPLVRKKKNHSQQCSYRVQTETISPLRQIPTNHTPRKSIKFATPCIFFDMKPQVPKMTAYQQYLQNLISNKPVLLQRQRVQKLEQSFGCKGELFPLRDSISRKYQNRTNVDFRTTTKRLIPQQKLKAKINSFGELEPWNTEQQSFLHL